MRAAVIGAGVYGATTAVTLALQGHKVDLYERHCDILRGATAGNCNRLHMGYHYPRADVSSLARDARMFAARFPAAVVDGPLVRHLYAVVMRDWGSKTTSAQYVKFLDANRLPYRLVSDSHVCGPADLTIVVPERSVDPDVLREILRADLAAVGVRLHLGSDAQAEDLDHDWIVRATYGQPGTRPLRYEVCETAVVRLGSAWEQTSLVVLDGPFACLDPLPGTPYHLLYDVVHSVHAANEGATPEVPAHLADLLDRGTVSSPHTHVEAMLDTARRYMGHLGGVEHVGSRWTVRAVLPDVDATDERPTMVSRDGRVITVIAGKLGSAVRASDEVAALVREAVPA